MLGNDKELEQAIANALCKRDKAHSNAFLLPLSSQEPTPPKCTEEGLRDGLE